MVRLGCALEAHFPQRLHHLVHVHVAVVRKCFYEVRHGRGDVAEMDFEDLAASAEISDHFEDVLAHPVAAFRPGAYTKCEPPAPTARRDLLGAMVAVVVREKL